MATSAVALFGVLSAKAKGEPLPEGVAYAPDGSWTTDAATALEGGAIATFGGHKGAGLSLVVELLAGGMTGGAVLGQVESKVRYIFTFIVRQNDAVYSHIQTLVSENGQELGSPVHRHQPERSCRRLSVQSRINHSGRAAIWYRRSNPGRAIKPYRY